MNKDLRYILELYGESPSDSGASVEPQDASLKEVKQLLDERPRISPPEGVIRDVLAAARTDRAPHRPRLDRRPVSRQRGSKMFVGTGSTLVVLMIAGLLFLWGGDEATTGSTAAVEAIADTRSTEEPALSDERNVSPIEDIEFEETPQRVRERAAPAVQARSPFSAPVQTASVQSGATPQVNETTSPALSWDDSDDLRDVHRMINVVQSRGHDIEWDEPAVPLELLGQPGSRPGSSVRQAGFNGNGRERP